MNKVTTTSTCGRCGAQKVRSGAHISDPPEGWATASLVRRLNGLSIVFHDALFDDALCPPCQDAVLAVLKPTVCRGCLPPDDPSPDCPLHGRRSIHAEAPDAD